MFWPFGKKGSDNRGRLTEIEQLILDADKSSSDEARHRLWEALDQHGYSQDEFYNIRSSLYKRLAQSGDGFAQAELGDIAHTEKNLNEALHWYTISAAGGCTEAMYKLGLWYSEAANGEYSTGGFGYDPAKSFKYFLQAAQGGHLKAMRAVVRCYEDGEGTEVNSAKALEWAQHGASLGSWDCCYYLAWNVYNNSLHPMYDQTKALQWYRKSTEFADRDQFEQTVRSMGYIYGAAYIYNLPESALSDRRKAAYCFTMAYITNHDDDRDKEYLRKTGYRISEKEFACLREDTINRRLSF
jgi:TPR repeat protein